MTQRHAPLRPLWICTACADPWPCAAARATLPAEYDGDRRYLATDLGELLVEAIEDLTVLSPEPPDEGELRRRFVGWVRTIPGGEHPADRG